MEELTYEELVVAGGSFLLSWQQPRQALPEESVSDPATCFTFICQKPETMEGWGGGGGADVSRTGGEIQPWRRSFHALGVP